MKELAEIISRARQHPDAGALATIVQTEGSSYRRPGARMLILPNGETVGSISGGCLEQDIIAHAGSVISNGEPRVLSYDTSTEEDLVFGVGLGCKGVVHVLVEALSPAGTQVRSCALLLRFVEELLDERRSGVVATVFAVQGETGIEIGSRMMVREDGKVLTAFQDAELAKNILESSKEILVKRRSRVNQFETGSGRIEILLEIVESPIPLVIFGAGFDAISLVRLAKEIGFHVSVADARSAYATRERFPQADHVSVVRPGAIREDIDLTDRTAAVIMSHNYALDRAFMNALLPLPLRYLGMMGPKKRAEKMFQESRDEGLDFEPKQKQRLHNPIGLDIGAESPEEIALSVLAEIQAVTAGYAGGLLCEKKSSIHTARNGAQRFEPPGVVSTVAK
ncbi:MAG: xanthine and dehydrogenase maturation factor, XdhC/CoxF family [Verrucomicrobiales bacterium]|nr:xanthine and dehydrogenase maturation factor, XdhC/CoxF family [Verrucomicrobiales bacterium]